MATKDTKNTAPKSDERNIVGPDQIDINDLENEVFMFWQKNRNFILGGVASLFIIFLGYNGWAYLQSQAEIKLQASYQAATSDQAKLAWAESESSSPLAGFAFKDLGDKAFLSGDYAKAETLYRKAAASAKGAVQSAANMALGATLVELAKNAEAKAIFQKIADDANNPARAEAQFRLGQIANREGDKTAARAHLEAIAEDSPVWKQRADTLLQDLGES